MTLVDNTHLYIIGGMSVTGYYSEHTYIVDIAANQWDWLGANMFESLGPTGKKTAACHANYIVQLIGKNISKNTVTCTMIQFSFIMYRTIH